MGNARVIGSFRFRFISRASIKAWLHHYIVFISFRILEETIACKEELQLVEASGAHILLHPSNYYWVTLEHSCRWQNTQTSSGWINHVYVRRTYKTWSPMSLMILQLRSICCAFHFILVLLDDCFVYYFYLFSINSFKSCLLWAYSKYSPYHIHSMNEGQIVSMSVILFTGPGKSIGPCSGG